MAVISPVLTHHSAFLVQMCHSCLGSQVLYGIGLTGHVLFLQVEAFRTVQLDCAQLRTAAVCLQVRPCCITSYLCTSHANWVAEACGAAQVVGGMASLRQLFIEALSCAQDPVV